MVYKQHMRMATTCGAAGLHAPQKHGKNSQYTTKLCVLFQDVSYRAGCVRSMALAARTRDVSSAVRRALGSSSVATKPRTACHGATPEKKGEGCEQEGEGVCSSQSQHNTTHNGYTTTSSNEQDKPVRGMVGAQSLVSKRAASMATASLPLCKVAVTVDAQPGVASNEAAMCGEDDTRCRHCKIVT